MKILGPIIVAIAVVILSVSCNFVLRQHGINSCRDRGGQPVVRSVFNESMWDVSCIERKKYDLP